MFPEQDISLDYGQVAIVIPALNEEQNLPDLIGNLLAFRLGTVIVVDNGSTDATAAVAQAAGAQVITEPARGYGAACWAGIQHATQKFKVVCFIDADMADDPNYLPALVDPILRGEVDFTIGSRVSRLRTPGAMTIQQTFGNWLATRIIRLGWNHVYHDLGPFRAIRLSALQQLKLRDRRYGWTIEMQIRALEEQLIVREIEVPYRTRAQGESKISGSLRGSALAGYWILRTAGVLAARRQLRIIGERLNNYKVKKA